MNRFGRFLSGLFRLLCRWVVRSVLLGALFVILSGFGILAMVFFAPDVILDLPAGKQPVVNDVTGMNPTRVERQIRPTNVAEIQSTVRSHRGAISIGGGRFSMGGQIAAPDSLHIDMRSMKSIIDLDVPNKKIRVEAGATWRQIQDVIDPHDLAVKVMPSYANFTVGGSLSANVHGRYIGNGLIAATVESVRIVLPNGELVEASRRQNQEILSAALGGYGGIGVITDATLILDENLKVQRTVDDRRAEEYPAYFQQRIASDNSVVFQNADLLPNDYNRTFSVVWRKTAAPVTESKRLMPRGHVPPLWERIFRSMVIDLPGGAWIRHRLEPYRYSGNAVVWRNFEASYDVSDLGPISSGRSTFALQEYFVPITRFEEFRAAMGEILQRHGVDVVNVSIRHATANKDSLLSWAPEEVFGFVVYYRQYTTPYERWRTGVWARELIDAALRAGGRHYLTYQTHATREQVASGYPRLAEYAALKRKLDPDNRFRNALWDAYLQPTQERQIREATNAQQGYYHPEERTFLALPEQNQLFAADEVSQQLAAGSPNSVNYFSILYDLWKTYAVVVKTTRRYYPTDWRYHFINTASGLGTTIEYVTKGIYENTIGRLTQWWDGSASSGVPPPDSVEEYAAKHAAEYAEFIHQRPWHLFPFYRDLRAVWQIAKPSTASRIRHCERKLVTALEYAAKAVVAKLIEFSTGLIDDPGEGRTFLVVKSSTPLDSIESVRVDRMIVNDVFLVSAPRHTEFTRAIRNLAARPRTEILEIAGNTHIVLTVLTHPEWNPRAKSEFGVVSVSSSRVPSRPKLWRHSLVIPVPRLLSFVRSLGETEVDQIYDY